MQSRAHPQDFGHQELRHNDGSAKLVETKAYRGSRPDGNASERAHTLPTHCDPVIFSTADWASACDKLTTQFVLKGPDKTSLNLQCYLSVSAVSGSADTLTAQLVTETHPPDAAWRWPLSSLTVSCVFLHSDHRAAPSLLLTSQDPRGLASPTEGVPEGKRTKTLSSCIYNP